MYFKRYRSLIRAQMLLFFSNIFFKMLDEIGLEKEEKVKSKNAIQRQNKKKIIWKYPKHIWKLKIIIIYIKFNFL